MAKLLGLDDLSLMNIFNRIPAWKLLTLKPLSKRMCQLVNLNFQVRKHMCLFGGYSDCKKDLFSNMNRIIDFPTQFDFVIQFDPLNPEPDHFYNRESHFHLSVDMKEENIASMLAKFPRVAHLTVVLGTIDSAFLVRQLLTRWPELVSLKILNLSLNGLFWLQIGPLISSMKKLEHFICDFSSKRNEFLCHLEHIYPILQMDQLKTCVNFDCPPPLPFEQVDIGVYQNQLNPDRTLQSTYCTFGVYEREKRAESDKCTKGVAEFHRVLKRVHVTVWGPEDTFVREVNITNWTAIRFLEIDYDWGVLCFSPKLIQKLIPLINLEDLSIRAAKVEFPKSTSSQRLPTLPSVRRFHLDSRALDPHQFDKLTYCVPNATECSFQFDIGRHMQSLKRGFVVITPKRYYDYMLSHGPNTRTSKKVNLNLCEQCRALIVRALEKYHYEVKSFIWFRETGEDGTQSMVPKIQLFIEDVARTRRFSHRYVPIY